MERGSSCGLCWFRLLKENQSSSGRVGARRSCTARGPRLRGWGGAGLGQGATWEPRTRLRPARPLPTSWCVCFFIACKSSCTLKARLSTICQPQFVAGNNFWWRFTCRHLSLGMRKLVVGGHCRVCCLSFRRGSGQAEEGKWALMWPQSLQHTSHADPGEKTGSFSYRTLPFPPGPSQKGLISLSLCLSLSLSVSLSLSLSLSLSVSLSLSLSLTHTHTHTHTMCVLGPTSHFSNLGLSDSCLFVLLTFSLAFVAMDVSPTLRARALSLNLTPSIHAPLLASFWD